MSADISQQIKEFNQNLQRHQQEAKQKLDRAEVLKGDIQKLDELKKNASKLDIDISAKKQEIKKLEELKKDASKLDSEISTKKREEDKLVGEVKEIMRDEDKIKNELRELEQTLKSMQKK
ncbi:MAG: hypothetical protein RJA61_98 [Candidatus Parcubacteria bacterium]|jgi:chromosome segregation ATPase